MSITTKKLAIKMKLKANELINTLIQLKIIIDNKTLTEKGIELDGEIKVYMGNKYINWKDEDKIINAIKGKDIKNKTSYQEKLRKGAIYEEFIAIIYKANGYTISEHGKDKGRKDGGIDVIAKKEKKIILIQCKNWNEKGKYKIDHKDIKVLRTEGQDFIKNNSVVANFYLLKRKELKNQF